MAYRPWALAELTRLGSFVDTGQLVRSSRKLPRDRVTVNQKSPPNSNVSLCGSEGRVEAVEEVVQADQRVKVKVLCEKTPGKLSLTIKDVDQVTGEDLNPNDREANPSHTPSGESQKFYPTTNIGAWRPYRA